MPLRSDLLTTRRSLVELPILPFLAPRAFTPWPSGSRKPHTKAQAAQRSDTFELRYGNKALVSEGEERGRKQQDFSLRRLVPKDLDVPEQLPRKLVDDRHKTSKGCLGNINCFYGTRLGSNKNATDVSSQPSLSEEFRRKYEEIWGFSQPSSDEEGVLSRKVESNDKVSSREMNYGFRGIRRVELWTKVLPSRIRNAWLTKNRRATAHRQDGEGREHISASRKASAAINHRRMSPKLHVRDKPTRFTLNYPLRPTSTWQKRFTLLYKRQQRILEGETLSESDIDTSRNRETRVLWEDLIETDSSASLRKAWEALSLKRPKGSWSELMLLTLEEHPTKALKFLAATYMYPYPPSYAVGDSLDFIISYYLRNRTARHPKTALTIFRVLEQMLRLGHPSHHFYIRQNSIYLLLRNLDNVFVERLFRLLAEYGHRLHKNTLMHFSSKLRFSGGADERIEVLQRLRREGCDFNSPEIMSVCVTLLQRKNRTSDSTFSDSDIFEVMLECGMMPNIVIYNVLLQNALEVGDHETGWQIHNMMVENGIETDGYTYSLLLSDAKLRNDRPSIERVFNMVSEKGLQNEHIVNDLLHTIFLYRQHYAISPHGEQRGRPSKTFEKMLSVYRQYFHVAPLAGLIPWFEEFNSNTPPVSNETLMDAPVPTLVVMLTALFRQLSEPVPVLRLYQHFCDLVQAGDPIATSLLKSTHICNVILKALGGFSETLAFCPRLIGDMLSQNIAATSEIPPHSDTEGNESSRQVYKPVHHDSEGWNIPAQSQVLSQTSTSSVSATLSTSQRKIFPKPNVYTWSVLLKAFMDHQQPRAAEKVLTMMKDRGVWPNEVTWSSLILGYARMQDMSMTVDAMHRLQESGFSLDGITMRGLAYFENRRALIEAMKALEASNPVRSLQRRPAAIGKAQSALNKTLRIVERDGLEPVEEFRDDTTETDDLDDGIFSTLRLVEAKDEFVVGDVERSEDEFVDLDR